MVLDYRVASALATRWDEQQCVGTVSTASQECLRLRQPLRSLDMSLIHVLACVGPSFIVARRPTARTAWAPNNTVIWRLSLAKLCLGLAARAFRAARASSSARKLAKPRTKLEKTRQAQEIAVVKRRAHASNHYTSSPALCPQRLLTAPPLTATA